MDCVARLGWGHPNIMQSVVPAPPLPIARSPLCVTRVGHAPTKRGARTVETRGLRLVLDQEQLAQGGRRQRGEAARGGNQARVEREVDRGYLSGRKRLPLRLLLLRLRRWLWWWWRCLR